MVCIKFAYNSGTSLNFGAINNYGLSTNLPYQVFNTGTPTRAVINASSIVMALGSNATTFYPLFPFAPVSTITNATFNNTNSAAQGNRFQVPFKCRCVGIRRYIDGSTGDFDATLFDDAGTALATAASVDGDMHANDEGNADHIFATPVTLSPGVWYRRAIVPITATNANVMRFTLPSADYRGAMPGGTNDFYATRASGIWTDTATDQVALIDILIDQIDDGVPTGSRARGAAGFA